MGLREYLFGDNKPEKMREEFKEAKEDKWDEDNVVKTNAEMKSYFDSLRTENVRDRIKMEADRLIIAKKFVENLEIPSEIKGYVTLIDGASARIQIPFLKEEIFVSEEEPETTIFPKTKNQIIFRYGSKATPIGNGNFSLGARYKSDSLKGLLKQIISEKEIEVKQ